MIEENTWLHLTFGTCELYFIIHVLSKRRRLIITNDFLGFKAFVIITGTLAEFILFDQFLHQIGGVSYLSVSLALNDVSINAAFLRNDLRKIKFQTRLLSQRPAIIFL